MNIKSKINLPFRKDIKDMMVFHGWSHWEGNYWVKGEGDLIKMLFDDAIIWELEYWLRAKRSIHNCPDCGYKTGIDEFIDNG